MAQGISWATGLALVAWLWPDVRRRAGGLLLWLALAIPAGLAVASGTTFLWLCVWPDRPGLLRVIDAAMLALLSILATRAGVKARAARLAEAPLDAPSRLTKPSLSTRALGVLLTLAALVVAWLALRGLAVRQVRMPHGDWDAWMIWNLKARFFYRAGPGWVAVLTDGWSWSHADYPLLLPLTVTRLWVYAGAESVDVPQFVTIQFTMLTFLLLYAGLAALRGRVQAALAMMFLASSGFFLKVGSMQCADVPVGLFMLGTCVAFIATRRSDVRTDSAAALAGLFASAAAWTKNEGILFAVAFLLVGSVGTLLRKNRPEGIRRLAPVFAGIFPLTMILIAMKTTLAGASDLVVGQKHRTGSDLLNMALSLDRHRLIWAYFTGLLRFIPDPILAWGLIAYAALATVVASARRRFPATPFSLEGEDRFAAGVILATLLILLAGDYAVYLWSPHDLTYHLSTSLERVFMQLWPTLVFLFFFAVRRPTELFASSPAVNDASELEGAVR